MLTQDIDKVVDFLTDIQRAKLIEQGHKLTGKLSKSIDVRSRLFVDGILFEGSLFDYGLVLNEGIKASRIPVTIGSGATSNKMISGLVQFAKLRRIATTYKGRLSFAFAVVKKWKKEGFPTKASSRFSKTGRRTGWLDEVLSSDATLKKMNELLSTAFEGDFEEKVDKFLKEENLVA